MRILVTEDEKDLADAIAKGLRQQGYAADIAFDGEEALFMADVNSYDLVILDLNLPKVDGIEVCRRLRETDLPLGILMLTARTGLEDLVKGLEYGADDYLLKPFHFAELLARLRAILRRKGEQRHTILRSGEMVLDPNTQQGYYKDTKLAFTAREFSILEYLIRNAGRIVSQEELLEHVWGEEVNSFTQSIKVHIKNIRNKLRAAGAAAIITTVKGRGYML